MNNIFASIFGEAPATAKAREARDSAFQAMLSSRRQAAEQQRTDNVAMARYNALGNVLTSMAQLGGWAAGGSTAGVQKYDDRQYIDAFNRAVKASDDIRNIGSTADEYRFKLADEDYKRAQALEDAERKRAQDLADDERKYQFQLEKQRELFDHQNEMQDRKADARMQLEQYKQSKRVTRPGTGLSLEDRILLKELDAYNKDVVNKNALGQPHGSFDEWLSGKGYRVENVRQLYDGGGNRGHADL